MSDSTTIRVSSETRDRLNALARRRSMPASELVTELVNEADDRTLLAEAEACWERLAADEEVLAAYRTESADLGGFDSPLPAY